VDGLTYHPIALPDSAWQRADVRRSLRSRDVAALFRFVQQYTGASQARIAGATGLLQGRVNEILNGRRVVAQLEVFERIADGLTMPDDARRLIGLAPRREQREGGSVFDPVNFPEVVRVFDVQASAAVEIQAAARAARQIDVLAVRGLGLLGLNDSVLRAPFAEQRPGGLDLRVLLLDPDSPAAARRAGEIGESGEGFAEGIRFAESRLRELAKTNDGVRVSVHRYRSVPIWRLIRLDSMMYVGVFDTEWEGHQSPTYKVPETPRGALYRGCSRTFEALLEDAVKVV
jgi:transcriptional regulator with XRE-family HTH domain